MIQSRACDGSWIKAWAKEFGVSVKGYGLCYHKEWIFQPLGWDFVVETDNKVFNPVVIPYPDDYEVPMANTAKEGRDFVVETDNKVFNPVVATSDKKQKKSGNRVTDFSKDEFKPAPHP